MTKKPTQNFTYWLKVIVIGIALGLGLQFVRAWTEPTTAPPNGNVGAPINTGDQLQSKSGSINVSGGGSDHGIWATGSNYAVGGQSVIDGIWGVLGYGGWGGAFSGPTYTSGYSYAASYMQAPVFYDTDGNYYVDPNGNSNLNKLNLSRTGAGECCSGGDATLSLSESTSSTGKKAGVQFHNGGVAEGQLRLDSGTNGRELKAYSYQTDMDLHATGFVQGDQGLCIGNICKSSWPTTTTEADTLQTVTNRGSQTTNGMAVYGSGYGLWVTGKDYGVAGNDTDNGTYGVLGYGGWGGYFHGPAGTDSYMQAPIFYDNPYNGYYIDIGGTSRLNSIYTDAFKMPTGAAAGKVLSSDASGNATWATDKDTWPAASSCYCTAVISCDGGQGIESRTYINCGSGGVSVYAWSFNVAPGYGATSCSGIYSYPCSW